MCWNYHRVSMTCRRTSAVDGASELVWSTPSRPPAAESHLCHLTSQIFSYPVEICPHSWCAPGSFMNTLHCSERLQETEVAMPLHGLHISPCPPPAPFLVGSAKLDREARLRCPLVKHSRTKTGSSSPGIPAPGTLGPAFPTLGHPLVYNNMRTTLRNQRKGPIKVRVSCFIG